MKGSDHIRDVQRSHQNAKNCYICKEKFEYKHAEDKKYCKVRDHCQGNMEGGAAHSICNLN